MSEPTTIVSVKIVRGNKNVIASARDIARFWSKVEKTEGCWNWTAGKYRKGYGSFNIQGSHFRAHRVSYELTHGSIPRERPCVLHACDNTACVKPDHLWAGTQAENIRDMEMKGRGVHFRGSKNGRAKLSDADVIQIRELHKGGERIVEISARFRVTTSMIGMIVRGKFWKHI